MPYPNPADLEAMKKDPNVTGARAAGPQHRLSRLQHHRRSPSTTCASARPSTWRSTRRRSSTRSILGTGIAAKNPIPPTMWSYNDAVKDDPYDPEAAKKLLAEAGFPNGFETDLWAMPVQRPYNPNAQRIAELMQADLAKVGVKAEIKSFEWGEYRKRMQAGEHQMAHARLDRRQRRSGQLPAHPARLRRRQARRRQHREVVLQAVRRPRHQGEGHDRPERAHQALREGAGDLQGAGAVVHDRPRGAAQADAQGSRRLQALARSAATRFYGVDIKGK